MIYQNKKGNKCQESSLSLSLMRVWGSHGPVILLTWCPLRWKREKEERQREKSLVSICWLKSFNFIEIFFPQFFYTQKHSSPSLNPWSAFSSSLFWTRHFWLCFRCSTFLNIDFLPKIIITLYFCWFSRWGSFGIEWANPRIKSADVETITRTPCTIWTIITPSTWRIWLMYSNDVREWKRRDFKGLRRSCLLSKSASTFRRTQCKWWLLPLLFWDIFGWQKTFATSLAAN